MKKGYIRRVGRSNETGLGQGGSRWAILDSMRRRTAIGFGYYSRPFFRHWYGHLQPIARYRIARREIDSSDSLAVPVTQPPCRLPVVRHLRFSSVVRPQCLQRGARSACLRNKSVRLPDVAAETLCIERWLGLRLGRTRIWKSSYRWQWGLLPIQHNILCQEPARDSDITRLPKLD